MGILFGKKDTHERKIYSPGSYVDGNWIEGTSTIDFFTADIQPISGEEAESLNIGERNLGKIKIYTNVDLNISQEGSNQSGDIITWTGDGKKYEVIGELNYDNNLLNHRKYIAEYRRNET